MNAYIKSIDFQKMYLLNHEVEIIQVYKKYNIVKVRILSSGIITKVGMQALNDEPDELTSTSIDFFKGDQNEY